MSWEKKTKIKEKKIGKIRSITWFLMSVFMCASSPPAIATIIPMTEEEWREASIVGRCSLLMLVGQELHKRSAKEYVNMFAGFDRAEVIHPAFAREQEKVREKFTRHHQRGRCLDREMTFVSEPDGHHRYYLERAYADSYAILMSYRDGASILALEQISDLRAISQVILPLSRIGNADRVFRYHTAPIIDHTIKWIEENGERLVDLDSDAVFALAQDLVGEAALSEEEYDNIKEALSATRLVSDERTLEGLRIDWAPSVPAETAVRIEGALARMGVRNRDVARYLSNHMPSG